MKKLFTTIFFCTSFFSYAAEQPNGLPNITRTKDLGDTGAEVIPKSALDGCKKTSVGHHMRRMSDPDKVSKHPDFRTIENLVGGGKEWSPGRRVRDVNPKQETKS